ncbi:CCT motif [Musa troglodytarum]|uniref:CCT motif n=1 Tax=Musa troglodytarum TaxID=320322 RepID=A0A9E7K6K8_9LILI|nr:CCT motif [Musa troglodytarum]URE08423.1 CCT motif [Musa troglodytarum]
MSSCLGGGGGGGRAYGFDLDIVKPSSPLSGRSSHSSSPSSTLSESSNTPLTISIKRARTPRKRPNQTYNEAAALLSASYPNIFSTKSLKKLSKNPRTSASFPESSDLLPPFPVLGDTGFLIDKIQPEKPAAVLVEHKLKVPFEKDCTSPVSNVSWEPNSPDPYDDDDDFDAESILDEEVEAGIDSIMGNVSTNIPTNDHNSEGSNHSNSCINPLLRSLIGCKMGVKFELGLGFRLRRNLQRALRNRDEGDWWRSPTVPVRDITPDINPSTATATVTPQALEKKKKKKKKKVDKEEVDGMKNSASASPSPPREKLKASLGLKLSHEEVINAWSDNGSIFSDGPDSPNSSADALARLADIDLFLDAAGVGGVREASVLRYKEKRRSRLFSKMIRYQVRKKNADRRPRMKGRFVRSPSLLQQAIEEERQ